MRLYDRLTGRYLDTLPDVVHAGRYLLRQTATLNRHTQLGIDDLLGSDGVDRCQLDSETVNFSKADPALLVNAELFAGAATTIAKLEAVGEVLPSPLLPATLISEQSGLSKLEQQLEGVLKAGHLHSISKRPRMDLRYEETVTEVSRARRLTNGTYTHLASHSECWQRQTLSGIQPKRVLARFSEDDYAIYENRVYARLLDGLDNYLTVRLRRLEALRDGLEKTLEFSQGLGLDHQLFDDICKLWGGSYLSEQVEQQLEATQQTLEVIGTQLKIIRGLKQTGLYLQVPRALQVGPALHRTNILIHDQHYRHLALLWDALHQTLQLASHDPAETLRINQQLESDYSGYAGLVLRHALHKYGLGQGDSIEWAGHLLTVCRKGLNWLLLVDETTCLELVPWACLQALPEDVDTLERPKVLCWPGIELGDCLDEALTGNALRLSPMDLYVVERMGYLVDQVLNSVLLGEYALPIQPLPKAVGEGCQGIDGLRVQDFQLQVISPLSCADFDKAQTLFNRHAKTELAKTFGRRVQQLKELEHCPVCGSPASIIPQGDGGFSSRCSRQGCDARRYWHRGKKGHWTYQQKLGDAVAFRINGRRSMEFSMKREL